jgi:hypothetical protein
MGIKEPPFTYRSRLSTNTQSALGGRHHPIKVIGDWVLARWTCLATGSSRTPVADVFAAPHTPAVVRAALRKGLCPHDNAGIGAAAVNLVLRGWRAHLNDRPDGEQPAGEQQQPSGGFSRSLVDEPAKQPLAARQS